MTGIGLKEGSGQDFLNDFAVNVGKAEVSAAIAIRETFVVEAEKMESSSMQVMNMRAFLDSSEPEVVGGTVGHAALDTAAGE